MQSPEWHMDTERKVRRKRETAVVEPELPKARGSRERDGRTQGQGPSKFRWTPDPRQPLLSVFFSPCSPTQVLGQQF